jgi:hypothetical protein
MRCRLALELPSQLGSQGEYRCPTCKTLIEVLDGGSLVEYRLTVQPSIWRRGAPLAKGSLQQLTVNPALPRSGSSKARD